MYNVKSSFYVKIIVLQNKKHNSNAVSKGFIFVFSTLWVKIWKLCSCLKKCYRLIFNVALIGGDNLSFWALLHSYNSQVISQRIKLPKMRFNYVLLISLVQRSTKFLKKKIVKSRKNSTFETLKCSDDLTNHPWNYAIGCSV